MGRGQASGHNSGAPAEAVELVLLADAVVHEADQRHDLAGPLLALRPRCALFCVQAGDLCVGGGHLRV